MTSTTNTAIKSSTSTKKKTNYYAKWYYLKNRDKLNQRAKEYYHNVKKCKSNKIHPIVDVSHMKASVEDTNENTPVADEKNCHCFFCTHDERTDEDTEIEDCSEMFN